MKKHKDNEINNIPSQEASSKEEEDISGKEVVKRRPGRPPGAKNKATLFKELMTGQFQETAIENIQRTYEVLFERAHGGDMKAIKLVLDRVVPVTKAVDLSDIEKGGITVNVSVGALETLKEDIEDVEYYED